eukprot:GDKH01028944.1.p2 GENE.GDKH01028944.1~~GDKH01028944.1.p2  ORF type:complete len:50 (+),score=5.56 GDKH01028944.1:81-230(+)
MQDTKTIPDGTSAHDGPVPLCSSSAISMVAPQPCGLTPAFHHPLYSNCH